MEVVIIVAGGLGKRMGSHMPKQLLTLNGHSIIEHTVQRFRNALPNAHILVVVPKDFVDQFGTLLKYDAGIQIVIGGAERYHSVANGLNAIPQEAEWVLVHDAVRCLISEHLIRQLIDEAKQHGNAIPYLPMADSMRAYQNGEWKAVDRAQFRLVQTPQVFHSSQLKAAFAQPFEPSFTDEASMVEKLKFPLHFVLGEKRNLKITTPEDLILAQCYLNERQ
jgi:2-C-methyl-D-erythritol 4-phosphate cytidylyltransferase